MLISSERTTYGGTIKSPPPPSPYIYIYKSEEEGGKINESSSFHSLVGFSVKLLYKLYIAIMDCLPACLFIGGGGGGGLFPIVWFHRLYCILSMLSVDGWLYFY